MKIRSGFVSNSSSSSFIIPLYKLSEDQKDKIYNHISIAKKIDDELKSKNLEPVYEWYEEWKVKEDDFCIWCATSMDNFDLVKFLIEELNIKYDDLIYVGDGYDDFIFDTYQYKNIKNDILRNKKITKVKKNLND